jgi:hypothetical protein
MVYIVNHANDTEGITTSLGVGLSDVGSRLAGVLSQREKTNKYDCVFLITSWFPVVAWKLSPYPNFYDPKPWMS